MQEMQDGEMQEPESEEEAIECEDKTYFGFLQKGNTKNLLNLILLGVLFYLIVYKSDYFRNITYTDLKTSYYYT